jgi:hypothetical protein
MMFRNELHQGFPHLTQPNNDDLFTFIHSKLPKPSLNSWTQEF